MDVMWSPWRSQYIGTFKDEIEKSKEDCFICAAAQDVENDQERLVVFRGKYSFALLNKYPYNNGHVMITPYRHIGDFELLNSDEMTEIMQIAQKVVSALKTIYNPHGFNIGANIGQSSGAGLPGHFHLHLVPRWSGDTSFMSTLADIKVVSISLEDTWNALSGILNESK